MKQALLLLIISLTSCISLERIKIMANPRMKEVNNYKINEDSTITGFVDVGYYKRKIVHSFYLEGLKIDFNPKKIKLKNRIFLTDTNLIKAEYGVLNSSYDGYPENGSSGWIKVKSINEDKGIVSLSIDVTVKGTLRSSKKRYKGNYKLKKDSR